MPSGFSAIAWLIAAVRAGDGALAVDDAEVQPSALAASSAPLRDAACAPPLRRSPAT